ncbi:MAG: hypothetical protein IJV98_01500 [Clostridia bacterium]|nr:hypothetical protein [Clostridia bacterium]
MAETWEDYGNMTEEEIYQRKSLFGKIFSLRSIKKFLKYLMYLLVLIVYGLLFFRLCTGKPPKELSEILWTASVHHAYTEHGGALAVYEQEPVESIADDGYFSISDICYIPEAGSFQLTVRYNNSSIEALEQSLITKRTAERRSALKAEHPEWTADKIEAALEESLVSDPIVVEDLGKLPFVFVLRDDYGNVYGEYQYVHDSKTVYQYMRIAYENVYLFGDGTQDASKKDYPTPTAPMPAYLYKGAHASRGGEVNYLYMDMYYINDADVYSETFAYPLQVYTRTSELTKASLPDEIPSAPVSGLTHIDLTPEH